MTSLELLAPARNADIGIAAVDCGADAVYIAGPAFGARKDAGNPVGEIARLCAYAHKFGVRVFVTFNISVRDDELAEMHAQMLQAQEAGADAFIIRDTRIAQWEDIRVPLHASTQCAIRTVEDARRMEALGCRRIILERQLSLDTVRQICDAVACEVEFFVHGALCVGYSGECRLSEHIDGRSADRGECIQACRSLYDLEDGNGRVLVRGKALLSLKDFNLIGRLDELADAGVCSFKIEGRLKNASYVRNVVRAYSLALDSLVASDPGRWQRASYGKVRGGFTPDLSKTFNRGYTELFIDGRRGRWASTDAPKSMGEKVGIVESVRRIDSFRSELLVSPVSRSVVLRNGDGFAFVAKNSIVGFRGDVCEGRRIACKTVPGLREGVELWRNVSAEFEKEMEASSCRRELDLAVKVAVNEVDGGFDVRLTGECEDGRKFVLVKRFVLEAAMNRDRTVAMIREGLGKKCDEFVCRVASFEDGGALPLLSAACINALRRELCAAVCSAGVGSCGSREEARGSFFRVGPAASNASSSDDDRALLRSKYCIRHELGMCLKTGGKPGPLYLRNNGRRLRLGFDCRVCEMTVEAAE